MAHSQNRVPSWTEAQPGTEPFPGSVVQMADGNMGRYVVILDNSLRKTSVDIKVQYSNQLHARHARLYYLTSAHDTHRHQRDWILRSVWSHHVALFDLGSFGVHDHSYLLVLYGGSSDIPLAIDDPLLVVQPFPGQEAKHTSSSNRLV